MSDSSGKKIPSRVKSIARKRLACTAYHEAGHAVAHAEYGLPARRVTIKSGGDYLGACFGRRALLSRYGPEWDSGDRNRLRMEKDVIILLAGGEAERRFSGRSNYVGAKSDREQAIDLLCRFASDFYENPGQGKQRIFKTYFKLLELRARELVQNKINWIRIKAVAEKLLEKETLSRKEVSQTMVEAVLKKASSASCKPGGHMVDASESF